MFTSKYGEIKMVLQPVINSASQDILGAVPMAFKSTLPKVFSLVPSLHMSSEGTLSRKSCLLDMSLLASAMVATSGKHFMYLRNHLTYVPHCCSEARLHHACISLYRD